MIKFLCSTQLSQIFDLHAHKLKCRRNKAVVSFKLSDVVLIMLMNVKMPTILALLL